MKLQSKRIAILAEDSHAAPELWYPLLRMREAGAEVVLVGMSEVREAPSRSKCRVGEEIAVASVAEDSYDAVIVPGDYVPDRMRSYLAALGLVRGVFERGGIVATFGDAGWVPISAGIVRGRRVTSASAIKNDLIKAGAKWVNQEVVQDGNLISSREPQDLPAFCRAIIAALE